MGPTRITKASAAAAAAAAAGRARPLALLALLGLLLNAVSPAMAVEMTVFAGVSVEASAAAGGWSEETYLVNGTETVDNGNYNPAVACDADGDCIVLFAVKPDKRIEYMVRRNGEAWPTETSFALTDETLKQEQVQVAVYGENRGWVIVLRDRNLSKMYTVQVAYITKADALEGKLWTGSAEGYGLVLSTSSGSSSQNRLGTLAADKDSNVVVVWQTVGRTEMQDGSDIGPDKDLVSKSFQIVEGSNITNVTQTTSLFSGIETDIFQDRNPLVGLSPYSQRIAVGATATIDNGYSEIMFSDTMTDVCGWSDRMRVTNFDGTDSDVGLAPSPHRDAWLLTWNHRSKGIRYALIARKEKQDKYEIEREGFVAMLAFPRNQGDEPAVPIADPDKEGYWAIFYRYKLGQDTGGYQVVFRVSKDDGSTWSGAYYAYDNYTTEYGRFSPVVTRKTEVDGTPNAAYMLVMNRDTSVTVIETSSAQLFDNDTFAENMTVPYLDLQENNQTVTNCFTIELPRDGSHLNFTEYIGGMIPALIQCYHIVLPDAPADARIFMNLEVLLDLELFPEYFPICPFTYIGIREEPRLRSGDFGLAALDELPRRMCQAHAYSDLEVEADAVYLFVKADNRGLPDENRSAVPLNLEAWALPTNGEADEDGDAGTLVFERRTAASTEELRAHLVDESFVLGEIAVNTSKLLFQEELTVRQGTNISIVAAADQGSAVELNGRAIFFVERGAVLARLRGFDIYYDKSEFTDQPPSRYGGLLFVQGHLERIEGCTFTGVSELTGGQDTKVGGAIFIEGHVGAIVDTAFTKMRATQGAAIAVSLQGRLDLIERCAFVSNVQDYVEAGVGGAIRLEGVIGTISSTTFQGNTCNGVGGAIGVSYGGSLQRVIDTNFIDNYSGLSGGAINFEANSRLPTLWRGGRFQGNKANEGAAIYVAGGLPALVADEACEAESTCFDNITFSTNTGVSGGAVQLEESASLEFVFRGVVFEGNLVKQGRGGALFGSGAVVTRFEDVNFSSNTAGYSGGALALASGAAASLEIAYFAGNLAGQQGGAIYAGNGAVLTVQDASFLENAANYTCREETVCELVEAGPQPRCGAVNGLLAKLNDLGQAPLASGCTRGVGGAVFIAAGVNAHIHQSSFEAVNPLPEVISGETYTTSTGAESSFENEAGRYVYAESRFRLSEVTFSGASTSFAPSTAVIGCPSTCSSTGTCSLDDENAPSVVCTCSGAYEGSNGYDEGGCSQLRVSGVRAQSTTVYQDSEMDADGNAEIVWTWPSAKVDAFVVYRTTNRSSYRTSADGWSSCVSADRAASEVASCVKVTDTSARSLHMGLRLGEASFFRVIARVDGLDSGPSDAMSSASIICERGAAKSATEADGMYECEACSRGEYFSSSKDACQPCPNELQTTVGVATSEADCVAPAGYYLSTAEDGVTVQVLACDDGLNCTEAGQSLDNLELEPGFWRPALTVQTIYECSVKESCVGGNGTSARARRLQESLWTDPMYCRKGHTGPFCAVCESGFSKDSDGLCSACTPSKTRREKAIFGIIVALVLLVWPLAISIVFYSVARESSGRGNKRSRCKASFIAKARRTAHAFRQYRGPLTITIGFIQVATGFQRVFGPTYSWWSQWNIFTTMFAWVNVDASRVPAVTGCVIEDRHANRLLLATITPVVLLLIVGFCFVLTRCLAARTVELRDRLSSTAWYISAFLMFLVFPSVNTTIVQTFVCDTFEDGSTMLRFDYATDCSDLGWVLKYARAMSAIYVVVPVLLFVALIAKSNKPAMNGASFLHRLYVPETQLDGSKWYHVRRYYEVFELLRKYLLTSAVLLVADGTVAQVAYALLVCFLATLLQTSLLPYIKKHDNILATVVHTQLFLILSALLISPVVENMAALQGVMVAVLLVGPFMAIFFIYLRFVRNFASTTLRKSSDSDASASAGDSVHLEESRDEVAKASEVVSGDDSTMPTAESATSTAPPFALAAHGTSFEAATPHPSPRNAHPKASFAADDEDEEEDGGTMTQV